jgi:putative MATE family efflux protein
MVFLRQNSRYVFRLYWPVFMESLLAVLMTFISSAMVKNISPETFAGVGLVSSSINLIVISLFMALSVGITVVAAQSIGRGAPQDAVQVSSQALTALFYFSVAMSVLLFVFARPLLDLFFGSADLLVRQRAAVYLRFSVASLPLLAIYSGISGIMRAFGNNVAPMMASMLANVALVAVTWLCLRSGMDVEGAGWGVAAHRVVCFAFVALILRRGGAGLLLPRLSWKLNFNMLKPVLRIALPSGMDSFFFNGTKLIVAIFIAGMGTAAINGNTASSNVAALTMLPAGAVSTICVIIVGQTFGSGNTPEARRQALKLMVLAQALAAAASLLSFPFLRWLIAQTADAEAAALTYPIMLVYLIATPIFWPAAFVLPNALRCMNLAGYTLKVSLVTLFILRLLGAWLLGVVFGLGLFGIWLSMMLDWVGRAAFFLPKMLRTGKEK